MLKARYIFTIVIGCLAFFYSNAQQNLILNGGFEDTLYCNIAGANNIQQFTHWYNPTNGGSFGIGPCDYNSGGWQLVRSGKSCVMAYSNTGLSNDEFNYIAGKFSKPLQAGKEYCFSMYVKLWYDYKYGSNNLAFFTSNGPVFYSTFYLIPMTPKVTIPYTVIDTIYKEFKGTFIATGGETDFVIGGYMPYANANYPVAISSAPQNGSVFVYDDISLTETKDELGNDKTICSQSDSVLLGDSAWVETKYRWYASGTLIDTLHSQIKVKPSATTTYVLQKENCLLTSDTITIRVIDDCSQLIDGIMIPNVFTPNGDDKNDTFRISIETGSIQKGTIYNRWGNIIYDSDLTTSHTFFWDGHTTSGEACNPGTYFYVISYTNSQGEQKTVKGFVQLFK